MQKLRSKYSSGKKKGKSMSAADRRRKEKYENEER